MTPHVVRRVLRHEPVNTLMTWPVAAVEATDSQAQVAQTLSDNEIGAVPVLLDGYLVGIVSERDLTTAAGEESDLLTAADLMSQHLVSVPPEAPVLEAARIMCEAHVRHLPVVSDGFLAGMLSMRDLFEVLLGEAENSH
jgi:CBS domain-containing protein